MKDLLSKEHFYHKIHTLLIKSSAYPPFIDNPYMDSSPEPPYPSIVIEKSQPPIIKGGVTL